MGKAMMGTGEAEGDNRAIEAASKAIANPLLDGVSMKGAKGVIVSITGGDDMRLLEVDEAANHIRELVDEDANIIWGSAFNPELEGKIRVSVVATGIEAEVQSAPPAPTPSRSFSFGNTRPAEPTQAAEPAPAAAPEPAPRAEAPATAPAAEPDELVLGSDTQMAPAPAPAAATPAPAAPVAYGEEAAEPAPEGSGRRRWLSSGSAPEAAPVEPAAPAPRVKLGGTLFERMSSVSRGTAREDEAAADKDAVEIPRFLHRQNNQ
jgi:cell division protein FtsZ